MSDKSDWGIKRDNYYYVSLPSLPKNINQIKSTQFFWKRSLVDGEINVVYNDVTLKSLKPTYFTQLWLTLIMIDMTKSSKGVSQTYV